MLIAGFSVVPYRSSSGMPNVAGTLRDSPLRAPSLLTD